MDLKTIVSGVIDVAEKLSPLLAGTPAGAIIATGKAVVDLIENVQHVASTDDLPTLLALRDELKPKVLAHLDRTINSLG